MPVDLTVLGVQHLFQMKTQIEQELEVFQNAFAQLKLTEVKLQESMDSIQKISPKDEGRILWVPLTASVYVEGKMADPEIFLIGVGGDYFIEMNPKDAVDYFERKLSIVRVEAGKLQNIGCEKSKARAVVSEVLQLKLQQLTTNQAN